MRCVLEEGAPVPDRFEELVPPDRNAVGLGRWLRLITKERGRLAHDVASPLTGVLAALETILEFEATDAGNRELLDESRRALLRVGRLLEPREGNLLRPSDRIHGALDAVVGRTVRDIATTIDAQSLLAEVEATSDPVSIEGSLLTGGLWVMLENAWAFRRGPKARVHVAASIRDGVLELSAHDDGHGIDPTVLARAGELAFTSRPSGVGLALFMLRYALRNRGGVRLERAPVGCVTTMEVSLAMSPV